MPPLVLSEGEIQQLQSIASSRSLPHSIVQRTQIVLACAAGETNTSIAKRMGLTGMTQDLLKVCPMRPSGLSLTEFCWCSPAPDPCQRRPSRALLQPLI